MPLNNFNYLVRWSDFTPAHVRPHGVDEDAQITVEMRPDFRARGSRRSIVITNVTVNIIIVSTHTWALSTQTTNADLLAHEQRHYDITALGAREYYDELLTITAPTQSAFIELTRSLRDHIQQQINRVNTNYDTQTNHYLNRAAQQTWDQRIAAFKANPRGRLTDLP